MPIPDTAIKGFNVLTEAWYADNAHRQEKGIDHEILIGFFAEGEGSYGEFSLYFKKLGNKRCIKLEVWSDAWLVLSKMPELVELLAQNGTDSDRDDQPVEWWKEQLLSLGFKDLTERERNQ
jgi:hypothetical protein